MPHRAPEQRLHDILGAIAKIRRYTAGMDLPAFVGDDKTIDAVIRNFTVIGEAATHLSDDYIDRHRSIPWSEMRGLRNVLVHEYFGVSIDIVWETVQHDLPTVEQALRSLLGDGEDF